MIEVQTEEHGGNVVAGLAPRQQGTTHSYLARGDQVISHRCLGIGHERGTPAPDRSVAAAPRSRTGGHSRIECAVDLIPGADRAGPRDAGPPSGRLSARLGGQIAHRKSASSTPRGKAGRSRHRWAARASPASGKTSEDVHVS